MESQEEPISRRRALAAVGAAAVAGAGWSLGSVQADPGSESTPSNEDPARANPDRAKPERMPTVFLPHGGGPWPFIDDRTFGAPGMWDEMSKYMRGLRMTPPSKPAAIVVISAHWEEPNPTVMTAARPPMLYDYTGFPKEAYEITWPAPGLPELGARIRDRLEGAGVKTAANDTRGFDHGTYVPLKLSYPQADIPTLQLSLKRGLDPREHLAIGRALAPLRDQGVFLVGSGMSYHNMRHFMGSMRGQNTPIAETSRRFDEWLAESIDLEPSKRETRLVEWERAPAARECHPREEHLLPLMVIAGASDEDRGALPYRDVVMNAHVSAVHFA